MQVTPGPAARYFTMKRQVKLAPNQRLQFAKGRGYYAGNLVGPASRTDATPTPAATAAPTLAQQVAQALQLQYAPLDAAEQQRQAEEKRTEAAYNAQQLSVIDALQKGVAPVAGLYDQAIGQTESLGREAANYFKGLNPNAGQQAGLDAVGAPQSQKDQIAGLDTHLFQGGAGALFTTGALLPGANLAADKMANVGYLEGLPTVAALGGQRTLAQLLQGSQDAAAKYRVDRALIGTQAPALLQKLTVQQAQAQAQADAARESDWAKRQQFAIELQSLGLRKESQQVQMQLDADKFAYQQQHDQATLGLAQQRLDSSNKNAALNRQATMQKTTATRNAAAAKAKKAARNTALRNRSSTRTKAIGEVNAVSDKATKDQYVTKTKRVPIPGLTPAQAAQIGPAGYTTRTAKVKKPRASYQSVRSRALASADVQKLKTAYGYTQAQVEALVDAQLAADGYKR